MSQPPVFYIFLTLCLLLAAGLTVAAVRRPNRQRLALRLLAGWLIALALWWLAYPPQRTTRAAAAGAILLTPGYQSDTLRRVLRQLGPATRLWRYGFATVDPDTPSLRSIALLRERQPGLRRLHILGQGLPGAALPGLGSLRVINHQPAALLGFQQATWNRRIETGQPLRVAGRFTAAGKQPIWLSLRGPGQLTDSVRLPGGSGAFQLQISPKAAGLAVYQLVARQAGKTVADEPVPVEVHAPQPLRILLLSSTAAFEFTTLKNYLGQQQHRVALRTGLSRGLTQTDFLNQPTLDLSRLSPPLLARYDMVVADAAALTALSPAETHAVQQALHTTGLGLILVAETQPLPRTLPGRAGFTVVPRSAVSDRPQPIRFPTSPASAATLVPATLRLAGAVRPLVLAGQRQPVVATLRQGLGTIVVSALPQTYPWLLGNAADTYAAYWSQLLRAAARPLAPASYWQVLTPWPHPHEPVALRLVSSALPSQPTVAAASAEKPTSLALEQDNFLPEWHRGQFWPAVAGWHQAQAAGQPPQSFYVFAAPDWQAPARQERQQAAAARAQVGSKAGFDSATGVRRPYPTALFFGLFLLAAGFLWLEEKR